MKHVQCSTNQRSAEAQGVHSPTSFPCSTVSYVDSTVSISSLL